MTTTISLGKIIAERRAALRLSLRDLGQRVPKENGEGVSAQYLHDIERDRRVPAPHVLGNIARALGVDPDYLATVAGMCPQPILAYLRDHPDASSQVAAIFVRAKATGFKDWEGLLKRIPPTSLMAVAR